VILVAYLIRRQVGPAERPHTEVAER